ncbi:MAG: xanthine/uracil permease [Defluviitaleaceae bacterium]|nr:xanthine/uracil permease [Defluviitaleaceae bacterium]MCL2263849.1 xanthine/uracil permease [Defluviitaleaceae bacterium]
MLQDLSVFGVAVVFVALNGLTMLAWAAAQGYKMKPTAFAFLVGAVGNLLTGSVTPISGQSSILTVSHFIKNVNERVAALLIAVIVMVPLGLTGSVTRIANWAGQPVLWGMMAGVGLMVAGISVDMFKQARRTVAISFIAALATRWFFLGNSHELVYVIAVSVTLASLDYVFLQTDPETGKRGRRVDLLKMAKEAGYEGDMEQNENPRFWTKEYWEDFKIIKPKVGLAAIYFALAFITLNIGTNIAFGTITAGMGERDGYGQLLNPQNMDHLTVINSLADIPSVIFGGAPVGAIISATAASPWPVMAGVAMMLLCMILLLLGLMTKAVKYVPVQAIAGFLFIIGFFSTFVPNLRNVFMLEGGTSHNMVEAATAMAVTALTKNPFLGLVAGVAVRYIGAGFFPAPFLL